MRMYRAAAVTVAALALTLVSACKESTTSSGSGTIVCGSADAAVCPPSNLSLGFNAGGPTIVPSNSNTAISVALSAFQASGTTSSTSNGYWFLVAGGTLRSWNFLTVTSGAFSGEIPLFCGAQQLIYRFDSGSTRSYWLANVTRTGCTTAAFRAQLSWDTGPFNSDIDLHLVRPGGTMFSGNDCYYGNCKVSTIPTGLEWGATGAAGNPSLDVDNTDGYGPENITISSGAEAGDYRIAVDNYNGVLSTHATVKIFFNDVEQARYTSLALDYASSREYWQVATVNILTGVITTVNTYSASPSVAAGAARALAPAKH